MKNETLTSDCAYEVQIIALGRAIDAVNKTTRNEDEHSLFEPAIHEVTLSFAHPVIWAKVLMENLGGEGSASDELWESEKLFWTRVTFELGPDWIAKFRRIGAFMAAVDRA